MSVNLWHITVEIKKNVYVRVCVGGGGVVNWGINKDLNQTSLTKEVITLSPEYIFFFLLDFTRAMFHSNKI